MALSDIIERIARDAALEADAILASATAEADRLVAAAEAEATDAATKAEHLSARQAEQSAETVLAGARLHARDAQVAARGELIGRALASLEERIIGLPDDAYTAFIARAVLDAATGTEALRVAAADRTRLAGLEAAVTAMAREAGRDMALRFETEPATAVNGVVLLGDRSANDLSVSGLIAARRESLVMRFAELLFVEGTDGA